MEKKYTSEEGLKFLEIAGISLPDNEIDVFKAQFDKIYQFSPRYQSLVGTLWDIYSNILPFKVDSGRSNEESYNEHLLREKTFQDNVIKSGLSDKLKSGASLEELSLSLN